MELLVVIARRWAVDGDDALVDVVEWLRPLTPRGSKSGSGPSGRRR
ncbi:MAG: hypothetical protein ACRDZQ_05120 [Acidimicrobiales bacterium]